MHVYAPQVTEGTTKRFNDNTKVIVVEGPPGILLKSTLSGTFDMAIGENCSVLGQFYIFISFSITIYLQSLPQYYFRFIS